MSLIPGRFLAQDGVPLSFVSPAPSPDGFGAGVIFVHGAGEHVSCYAELAARMRQGRTAFFGLDLRGYGASGGKRAWVRRFTDYDQDVIAFARLIRSRYPELPIVLAGHSMGGLIAVRVAARAADELNLCGLILSAPCIGLPSVGWQNALRRVGGLILAFEAMGFSAYSSTRFMRPFLARDSQWLRERSVDPLIVEQMSLRLFLELSAACVNAVPMGADIRLPAAIMMARDDKVVDNTAIEKFFDRLNSKHKMTRVFNNSYHEILHDCEKREAAAWFLDRVMDFAV